MQLITVGTVAFDRIETPFGVAEKTVGGAATYISLAASCFLERMGLVSVVGDDFPTDVMEQLEERGVDLKGLEVLKGKESFFWVGRYHYDMNTRDTLETRLNVLLDLDPKLPEEYTTAPYVMLGNLDPTVQGKVLDQMKERPALDTERTDSTAGRPFMALSSGTLISCSTSSAAMPPASVITVTVGLLRSGNTSTGMRVRLKTP